ncbi:MAG: hypothetical protein AB1921_15525 [Thermodesulfobacteriota bacterium]
MEQRAKMLARCLTICGLGLMCIVYASSYILLRQDQALVHKQTIEGGRKRHSIQGGAPPMSREERTKLLSAQDMATADPLIRRLRRREKLILALYAPARWVEELYWAHEDP